MGESFSNLKCFENDDRALGVYVHIPYCLKKCNYCDFFSKTKEVASLCPDDYANRVCEEIERQAPLLKDYTVDSVFFGGGTPSCIGTDLLGRILICIKNSFHIAEDAEISIEVNPETINEKNSSILRFLGFNRVSMGVQSLDDEVLKVLGRVHDAKRARDAYKQLRAAGFENINLDLMLGVPDQSFEIFKKSLDEVILMGPEHISFYSLQLEEGTPFYDQYRDGLLDLPELPLDRKMYRYAVGKLKDSGYHHYEISNAAKPGKECRHNIKYWTMKPYIGFGSAAHSFIDGKRFCNTEEFEYTAETDDNTDLETDWIFTGLRLIDGTDFGEELCKKYEKVIDELILDDFIIREKNKLKFTKLGLDNTNIVISKILNNY